MKIIIIPNTPVMAGRHYRLAKSLVDQGHEIHYMMWELPYNISTSKLAKHLFTSLIPKSYKHKNFYMHKVTKLPYFWPYINGFLFKNQIRKLYKTVKADVIITESYTNETEVPKDLPFIYDLADDYAAPADIYGSSIYKLAFKLLGVRKTMEKQSKNAIAVTAVSDLLYKYAKKFNTNVIKSPNGVDAEIIKKVKNDKSTYPTNKYSLIYVTGFGKWSRVVETMQAVTKLREELPMIDLTLVGDGTEAGKIKKYIKNNNAEKYIHFLGFIHDRKKVFRLINQSSVCLNISDKNKWRDAAHPMKVIEYSALGKKVVSTDLEEVKKLKLPNIFIFSDKSKKNNLVMTLSNALGYESKEKDFRITSKNVLHEYDWHKLAKTFIRIINTSKKEKKHLALNKIVHVSHAYPPAIGGLEKVVQALARTQKKTGLNVSVITSAQKALGVGEKENFSVTRLKTWNIANTNIMPGLFFKLLKLRDTDIVHVHIVQAYIPEIVYLASLLNKFRYVAHIHLDVQPSSKAGFLLESYKSYILKRVLFSASQVVVPTVDYKELLCHKYGLQKEKIRIVSNATNHTINSNSKILPNRKLRFLFVGRFSYQKNIPFLLESLSLYAKKYKQDFLLTIVGNGNLKEKLKKDIRKFGLHRHVHLKGQIDGKALEKIYKNSDIFLLTSTHESFAIVLIEAMTKGLPIVSTNIPAVKNVITHKKNGLLVKHTPIRYADALHKLVSDKQLYEIVSRNNIRKAKKYSWLKSANKLEEIYKNIL